MTDEEKKILVEFIDNDKSKFYSFHNLNDENYYIFTHNIDKNFYPIIEKIFTKLNRDEKSGVKCADNQFKVHKSIIDEFDDFFETIDKNILLQRFRNMIEGGLPILGPTEIIKNNKIKFYIKKDDDSLKNGENYAVQIAHEENGETKFWFIYSTHENEVGHKKYCEKLKQLAKIFNGDIEFNVVDYIFGSSEMNVLKDSPSSQELKDKISKNEFVSIDNKEFIDVTEEVTKIIADEFNNQKKLMMMKELREMNKIEKLYKMQQIKEKGENKKF